MIKVATNTKPEKAIEEMKTMFEQLTESNQYNALCVIRSLVFAQAATANRDSQKTESA